MSDTGQRPKTSSSWGSECFWGHGVEISFSSKQPSQPSKVPRGVFCIGLQVSGGAVSGHQVVFFTLWALATLSYRTSHAWQLNALWSSSHLENKASAMHCGQVDSSSPTKTHASSHVSLNCSIAEKAALDMSKMSQASALFVPRTALF